MEPCHKSAQVFSKVLDDLSLEILGVRGHLMQLPSNEFVGFL